VRDAETYRDKRVSLAQLQRIARATEGWFGLPEGSTERRKADRPRGFLKIRARQIGCHLMRGMTGASFETIAKYYSLHHTTVLNGIQLVDGLLVESELFRCHYWALRDLVESRSLKPLASAAVEAQKERAAEA